MTFPTKILMALALVLASGAHSEQVVAKDSDSSGFTAQPRSKTSTPNDQRSLTVAKEIEDDSLEGRTCDEECAHARPAAKTVPALHKIPLQIIGVNH